LSDITTEINVENEVWDFGNELKVNAEGTGWLIEDPIAHTFVCGDQAFISGAIFSDPIITLALGFTDSGLPSDVTVSIDSPINPPITEPANGNLHVAGSFMDGGNDGGSVSPSSFSQIAQATIEGAEVASAGPGVNFASPTDFYGPYNSTYSFDCSALGDGQCDSFGLQISLAGSGDGDTYAFSARHEINPSAAAPGPVIPEPTTLLLLGTGLIGLASAVRKKIIK
jgi:hypothetical protein